MKILLTGASGRLGQSLLHVLRAGDHQVSGTALDDPAFLSLDLSDFSAVRSLIETVQPEIVIHTAAWTDVDGCARDPERAVRVNGLATQNLAVATAAHGIPLLYVSSNEVFDGEATSPYREYDRTRPINPYGYSKWVGEQAVLSLNARHYIVRTSWMFAHGGTNFIHTVLKRARAGEPLRVVVNEVANPTYADDLAAAAVRLIQTGRFGIYHLVNEQPCSRFDFARRALDRAGLTHVPIERIHSREWIRPTTPPQYSALANQAARSIGITLRPWIEALDDFLQREGLLTTAS
ncbi:MAG: dTDP-4-dehydrorhamnose reductase [Candidatus Flexifilum sp.]|jgi:dTDP-4-dehydrorhamnose reductase